MPNARVVERDLIERPLPHIDPEFVRTMFTEDAAEALALSNTLIDEVLAADVLLIESPMYNFSIPSALKAWLDHIVRARKTFRITPTGVEGLLTGKRGIFVLGSGGIYSAGPYKTMDFQEPYLRAMFGFIGMTDVEIVRVEGLNMGPDGAKAALVNARERVDQMFAKAVCAA